MGTEQVTCFQAANQSSDGEPPQYVRVPVPLVIVQSPTVESNNQQVSLIYFFLLLIVILFLYTVYFVQMMTKQVLCSGPY